MNKVEMIRSIDLGKGIAEMDTELIKHYITNNQTSSMIKGKNNIVLGAKGTGKSSILKYIISEKDKYLELKDKVILKAMNHEGDLVFKELLSKADGLDEDDFIVSWKIYFISLIWNELESDLSKSKELRNYLKKHNIILKSSDLKQMIKRAVAFAKLFQYKLTDINGFEHSIELKSEVAMEYIENVVNKKEEAFDADYVYTIINRFLEEMASEVWIMIDRVDEAIINNPELETKALRALLRTFNAIQSFDKIKLKLMLRDDIFRNITTSGFVALSHIEVHCTPPIIWTKDDLMVFIVRRIFSQLEVREYYGITIDIESITAESARDLFYTMFEEKVDTGAKKPETYDWIYNHLSDGDKRVTPRDFIIFFETFFSLMEASELSHPSDGVKISRKPFVFKQAWITTSEKKLEMQIYAEYYELKESIEKFRGGKAKHNITTLTELFGEEVNHIISSLVKLGVLYKGNNYYEVPFLYRAGLEVRNGNAY